MRFNFEDDWNNDVLKNVIINRNEKYNPMTSFIEFQCIELDSLSQKTGELLATYNSKEQKSIKSRFYANDVLYGKLRPYLRKYYHPMFDGVCSSEIWVLTSKVLNPSFLYQYIQINNFNEFANISSGSKMPRADWSIISDSLVYYPDNNEMKKIGYFLSLLDQRIKTQNKIINKYESLINEIEDQILWRNNGISHVLMKHVLKERTEKSIVQDQYPLLSSTVKGLFLQSEYFQREIASTNNIGYKVTRYEDIIISPQNLWMGNITYNDEYEYGLVSPSYHIYEIKNGYNKFYISILLRSYRALHLYKTVSEQGASVVRRNLNLGSFMEIQLPIPSKEKQDEVGNHINQLHLKLNLEKEYLEKLIDQKNYLLNNMFI